MTLADVRRSANTPLATPALAPEMPSREASTAPRRAARAGRGRSPARPPQGLSDDPTLYRSSHQTLDLGRSPPRPATTPRPSATPGRRSASRSHGDDQQAPSAGSTRCAGATSTRARPTIGDRAGTPRRTREAPAGVRSRVRSCPPAARSHAQTTSAGLQPGPRAVLRHRHRQGVGADDLLDGSAAPATAASAACAPTAGRAGPRLRTPDTLAASGVLAGDPGSSATASATPCRHLTGWQAARARRRGCRRRIGGLTGGLRRQHGRTCPPETPEDAGSSPPLGPCHGWVGSSPTRRIPFFTHTGFEADLVLMGLTATADALVRPRTGPAPAPRRNPRLDAAEPGRRPHVPPQTASFCVPQPAHYARAPRMSVGQVA